MTKRSNRDFDDGIDDESFFEDEEFTFERSHGRRDQRPPTRSPKDSRDGGAGRHSERPNRRRELASLKAWGTPY